MKTYVVIPNLNGEDYLSESLASIEKQTAKAEIIVVDNASTDGSVNLIREQFPSVILLEQGKNLGFSGGVNVGIRYALDHGADYVALFNNDAVAEPDWLANLLKTADKHPEAGMVTGKFMRWDRKHIDSTGDQYSIWGFPYPRGRDEVDKGQYDTDTTVFGCTGGATLYRAEMLRQVGLFDEAFFAYYEDVDLSFRSQLAGWKALYEPGAVSYHHLGGTSNRMSGFSRYHTVKNFFYLYHKNMPGRLWWRNFIRFKFSSLAMFGNSLRTGQLGPTIRAYWSLVLHIPALIVQRRTIQKSRVVSDEYIDSLLLHDLPPTQRRLLGLKKRLGL